MAASWSTTVPEKSERALRSTERSRIRTSSQVCCSIALRELKSTVLPLFVVVAAYVKDNAFPALYDTCTVQIRVRDRNDNAPTFSESDYRVRVRENTRMAALYTAIASDADEDGGADISYYITGKSGQYLRNTPYVCFCFCLTADYMYKPQLRRQFFCLYRFFL